MRLRALPASPPPPPLIPTLTRARAAGKHCAGEKRQGGTPPACGAAPPGTAKPPQSHLAAPPGGPAARRPALPKRRCPPKGRAAYMRRRGDALRHKKGAEASMCSGHALRAMRSGTQVFNTFHVRTSCRCMHETQILDAAGQNRGRGGAKDLKRCQEPVSATMVFRQGLRIKRSTPITRQVRSS